MEVWALTGRRVAHVMDKQRTTEIVADGILFSASGPVGDSSVLGLPAVLAILAAVSVFPPLLSNLPKRSLSAADIYPGLEPCSPSSRLCALALKCWLHLCSPLLGFRTRPRIGQQRTWMPSTNSCRQRLNSLKGLLPACSQLGRASTSLSTRFRRRLQQT